MKIPKIFLIFLLLLAGTNAFFYSKNQSLEQDISDKKKLCDDWLAKLALKGQSESVVKVKTNTIHISAPTDNPDTLSEEAQVEETDIERLVSHSHRMQAVTHKYEFLILSAQIKSDEKELLKRLLLKRERLSNLLVVAEQKEEQEEIEEIESNLYQIEDQIELVLHDPLDYHRYELIKQSQL